MNRLNYKDKGGKKKKLNDDTFKERTDKNLCYNCGKSDHYANDCSFKKSLKDDNISKVQQTRAERRSTSPEAHFRNDSEATSDSEN
jgi:Zinc knuckle